MAGHGRALAHRADRDGSLRTLLPVAIALLAACGAARRGAPFGAPLQLDETQRRGEVLYMRWCNGCHPGGAGGIGPALANKPLPPLVIKSQVRLGAGAMPAFDEAILDDDELDAIDAYVNALQETAGPL